MRLLQIDTAETYGTAECFGAQASAATRQLLPAGSRVKLVADPGLDSVDSYGRLLRYVYRGGRQVNLALVERGDATVYQSSSREGSGLKPGGEAAHGGVACCAM